MDRLLLPLERGQAVHALVRSIAQTDVNVMNMDFTQHLLLQVPSIFNRTVFDALKNARGTRGRGDPVGAFPTKPVSVDVVCMVLPYCIHTHALPHMPGNER